MAIGDAFLNLTGLRKVPLIRQAEAAECGLACLGMVAAYFGDRTDLPTLRREYAPSLRGCTLKDLVQIASQLNLGSRAVRCELEELRTLRTPAILHWNMQHFVVLTHATRTHAVIHDPAEGRVRRKLQDIDGSFTGVALELTPTSTFRRRRPSRPLQLSSLVRFDGSTWRALCQGLVLSLLLQVFVLLSPYFMQLVVDEAILKGDLSLLGAVAVGFALLKIFEVMTTIVRGLVFQFLSNILTFDMKASLFHHLSRLPLQYFHRRHVGDIQQRFQALQPVCDLIVNGLIAAFIDGALAIVIVALLFAYDVNLAVIVMAGVLLYGLLRLAFLQLSRRLAGDRLVAMARESSTFLETLRAIQAIKVAGAEAQRENLWRNLSAASINAAIRVGNVSIGYSAISQALLGLSTITVVYVAAQASIAGKMTVGTITAFLAYKGQVEDRFKNLLEQFINWRTLDVSLERVADIALHQREAGIDAPPLEREFSGTVDLVDVRFAYASHEAQVLRGASLSVGAGEFIAIAGVSGAGKSTLLRLLAGLYEPTGGHIHYDDIALSAWGPRAIREQIGVVMQDDTLLAGTIAENIAMFAENIDMDRVAEAATTACIRNDVERMPMGYRSLVGDMGSSLSGGQQQRVMLARALYNRPKLLIMDEGTAHLDIETERRVNAALRALSITRIVAAHRPETLAAADRVMVLHEGRLEPAQKALSQADHRASRSLVTS